MKYRKKQVVVEAFQMTEERRMDNSDWPYWLHQAWQKDRNESGALQRVDMDAEMPDALEIVTLEGNHRVSWGDWIIQGVQGEIYPCKPEIFTATYEHAETKAVGLNFGRAIEALKEGRRIAREGWNGKGMFLFLLPAGDGIPTKVIHDPALREVIETEVGGDTFDALGSIRMFTADKKILTGWLASQTDMLAEDWMIL